MERTADARTANFTYAVFSYMAGAQQECYDKCVVDFQTRDLGGMENMCISDCIRKSQVLVKEMQSAEYVRNM